MSISCVRLVSFVSCVRLSPVSVSCRSYPVSVCLLRLSVSCVRLVCLSRLFRVVFCLVYLLRCCVCLVSFAYPLPSFNSFKHVIPVIPVMFVMSRFIPHLYPEQFERFDCLPLHPFQNVKINFFKSLSGSTCLTELYLFRVFGVFGVFEVFKVVRGVQRFHSYNTLSKSHNSFSCPYRL